MDPKDLRSEATLGECINNGNISYTQSTSTSTQTGDKNKTYHDIGSNTLGKVGSATSRPCAVIGPDRAIIAAPQSVNDDFNKRDHLSHWPLRDNMYQQASFYPQKSSNITNPQRNISPRQTFQENMQRIMVPPTYTKINEDHNFLLERSDSIPKIVKSNEMQKYCDVPFTVNPISTDHKSANNCDMPLPNVNSAYLRPQNHAWPQNVAVSSHPQPRYGSPDLYQYNDFASCAVPSNMPYVRPQRGAAEEPIPSYAEHYHRGGNIRFEPYPPAKDRYLPPRYDYINRYPNSYQPPTFANNKFEMQKLPPSYPTHLQGTYIRDPGLNGYQRNPKPQINFNVPFPGHGISSKYSAIPGNNLPNKYYPYSDHNLNSSASPQGPYDQRNKVYVDYKGIPPKPYPASQNYYMNEFSRPMVKGQAVPNYSSNVHPLAYYRKDIAPAKTSEFLPTFKQSETVYYNSSLRQHTSNVIGPYDPSINNVPSHQYRRLPEDPSYMSHAHGPVLRNINPAHHQIYNNYDSRFGPMMGHLMSTKFGGKTKDCVNEDKKNIDLRQFLQSWSEGDDEGVESASNGKEIIIQTSSNFSKQCDNLNNQEQLYVLGLVNVPSEELSKYEHIQKVSKLPDNIKGYTNIDLLNQFEEAIESSKSSNPSEIPATKKQYVKSRPDLPGRPVSPLDVEAKISQSVIHKDVGCNFEIRPCSPGLVQVAAPAQPLGGERTIEKVSNPISIEPATLLLNANKNNVKKINSELVAINDDLGVSSCGKANTSEVKLPYSMHDLESNSGVCLASLPRLDNDIELNFPEVNQQFINANKQECVNSVLTTMTDFNDNPNFPESNESYQNKDYSKLIKYRKSKSIENDNHTVPIRTDSVIKNNLSISENTSFNAHQSVQLSLPVETDDTHKIQAHQKTETNAHAINLSVSSSIGCAMEKSDVNNSAMVNVIDLQSKLNPAPSYGNNNSDLPSYLLLSNNVSMLADDDTSVNNKYISDSTELNNEDLIQANSNVIINSVVLEVNQNQLKSKEKPKDQDDIPETNDSIREYIEKSSAMNKVYAHIEKAVVSPLNEEITEPRDNINNDTFVSSKQSYCYGKSNVSSDCIKLIETFKYEKDKDYKTDEIDYKGPVSALILDEEITEKEENISNNSLVSPKESNFYGKSDISSDCIKQVETAKNEKDKDHEIDTIDVKVPVSENVDNIKTDNKIKNIVDATLILDEEIEDDSLVSPKESNLYDKSDISSDCIKLVETAMNEKDKDHKIDTIDFKVPLSEHVDNIKTDNKIKNIVNATLILDEEIAEKKENIINDSLVSPKESNLYDKSDLSLDCIKLVETDMNEKDKDHKIDTIDFKVPVSEHVDNIKTDKKIKNIVEAALILDEVITEKIENIRIDRFVSPKESYFYEKSDISLDCIKLVETAKNEKDKNYKTDEVDYKRPVSEHVDNIKTDIKIKNIVEAALILDENDTERDRETRREITEIKESSPLLGTKKSYKYTNPYWIKRIYSPVIQNLMFCLNKNFVLNRNLNCDTFTIKQSKPKVAEALSNVVELTETTLEGVVSDESNDVKKIIVQDSLTETKQCDILSECMETSDNHSELASKETVGQKANPDNFISSNNYETNKDLSNNCKPNADFVNCKKYEEPLNQDFPETRSSCLEPDETPATPRPRILKRSLSESALSSVADKNAQCVNEPNPDKTMTNVSKRKRRSEDGETHIILENNFGRVFHINRRNSISAFCEDNVSFCIMIDDNCLVAEETVFEGGTICFANIEEENFETNRSESLDVEVKFPAESENNPEVEKHTYDSCAAQNEEENWVDDIACVETVVSDETEPDCNNPLSPTSYSDPVSNQIDFGVIVDQTITEGQEIFYDESSCFTQDLYTNQAKSASVEVLINERCSSEIKRNCLEELLSSSDSSLEGFDRNLIENGDSFDIFKEDVSCLIEDMTKEHGRKDNFVQDVPNLIECKSPLVDNMTSIFSSEFINEPIPYPTAISEGFNNTLSSSSNYKRSSSSPEVTSTTSDDKKSIMLKIKKHNGARTLEVNNTELSSDKKIRCKFTENEDFLNTKIELPVIRPLITKGAQKYIPPLKETFGDLKVKLRLPKDSLKRLKQLKHSKTAPSGIANSKEIEKTDQKLCKPNIVTKQKPKFEDVLKSIDEFQLKTSKEKTKKVKKHVPKVIIKKTENGSHYASHSNKDFFNPDLTGRKWQPWVFLEKNSFIDKMALRGKRSAVYCHRKKTYILLENFRKYRSINNYNTEFVISKKSESYSCCPLKYTIRLKRQI